MARNLPPTQRRTQFAAAAQRAMSRKGTFNVSLRDVAREAGVSPGAILYHYDDFEAVLVAAWQDLSERFGQQRRRILELDAAEPARLATAIHHAVPSGSADERYLLYAAIGHYRSNATMRALARATTHAEIALYHTIIEAGSARGVFTLGDRSIAIARTIVGLTHGLGIWIVHDDPEVGFAEGEHLVRGYAEALTSVKLPSPLSLADLET
ncbi:MAG TPA: TetR/AcrR family transcriptional regulator [Solirubrobacteraceae bacterium]|nr:TetR/AcrR family transcriptional regulator [Solirubrobacteraceae bacterium]